MSKVYQLSPDGGYLSEASLPALRRLPARPAWLHTAIGPIKRSVSGLTLRGRRLWADRATGTLFRMSTGQCLACPELHLRLQPGVKRPRLPAAPPVPVPAASPRPAATPAAPAATKSGAAA